MKQFQPIVALDSNILMWGIRKKGDPNKVRYARYLFQGLQEENAQIILPSVAVAEFLIPFKLSKEREAVIAEMRKRFIIAPFDARAAAISVELWHDGKKSREKKQPGARAYLRADSMIVATAYSHGAQVFYTDDVDCANMARKRIPQVRGLPRIGQHLWADSEHAEVENIAHKLNTDEQQQHQ